MSALTFEQLQTALKDSIGPVTTEIREVKVAFKAEISNLRLDTDKKYSDLADRITKIENAKMPPTYNAVASMPALTSSRQPPSREDYNKELSAAQMPRGYRFRGNDYEAKMRATEEQRQKHEHNYAYAYKSLGFYPCGDQEDRDQAKTEFQSEGYSNPNDKAIERRCVKNYLTQDMGMTEDIFEEVAGDVENIWFEGKTAFCKFVDRRAIAIVYSFASLMNKMAKTRHVVRKIHLWIPPSLESRFFQLKDLEWNFRRMKTARKEYCHTRITYEGETIIAQWRGTEGESYQKIEEPASQGIPGIEFSRMMSARALNNRGKKPLPLPKPDPKATTPKGRERPMEAARGQSKGSGRGGKQGAGAKHSAEADKDKAKKDKKPPGEPKKKESVVPAGSEHNNSVNMETDGSLNFKAVGQSAESNSQSARGSKRGRKPKASSSQSNTMLSMGWAVSSQKKKRSRSSRRDSSDEELWEESKSQKMDKKKTPEKRKSPVKPKNVYTNLVDTLKVNSELSEKRAEEYSKLLQLTNKQGSLYEEVEKGLRAGDEIDMARLNVLTKM